MKSLRLLPLIAIAAFVTGCAGMKEAYNEQECNRTAGYSHGMNDARGGQAMDPSFTQSCYDDTREVTQAAYREGYEAGLASMRRNGNVINVSIGGGASSPAYSRAYYCEVQAFTDHFEGWGATETEARVSARNACTRKFHEMHCREAACRRS